MCLDQVPPAGVDAARARGGRAPHDRVGARASATPTRAEGQLRFAINQGGTDPELRRRSRRGARSSSTSTATRSAGSRSARTAARCSRRPTGSTALLPAGQAALLHGHRRPEGILEVIEAGRRHVRLRAARPAPRAPAARSRGRAGSTSATPASPATRAPLDEGCDCPACTRVHAGVHPPPREPERAARPAPALAPQSTLPARADRRRARGDRARRVRLLQTRRPGAPRQCRP